MEFKVDGTTERVIYNVRQGNGEKGRGWDDKINISSASYFFFLLWDSSIEFPVSAIVATFPFAGRRVGFESGG